MVLVELEALGLPAVSGLPGCFGILLIQHTKDVSFLDL